MIASIHSKYIFPKRVETLVALVASLIPNGPGSVLDLGAGDGLFAKRLKEIRPELQISAVDSFARTQTHFPVELYDGKRLAHQDSTFDWVILVDVIHHAKDTEALVREAARVARKGVVIKDHLSENPIDAATLYFMDIVGNRRFGVALGTGYLSQSAWKRLYKAVGLTSEEQVERLHLYAGPLDWIFGRSLHFVARLRK